MASMQEEFACVSRWNVPTAGGQGDVAASRAQLHAQELWRIRDVLWQVQHLGPARCNKHVLADLGAALAVASMAL